MWNPFSCSFRGSTKALSRGSKPSYLLTFGMSKDKKEFQANIGMKGKKRHETERQKNQGQQGKKKKKKIS